MFINLILFIFSVVNLRYFAIYLKFTQFFWEHLLLTSDPIRQNGFVKLREWILIALVYNNSIFAAMNIVATNTFIHVRLIYVIYYLLSIKWILAFTTSIWLLLLKPINVVLYCMAMNVAFPSFPFLFRILKHTLLLQHTQIIQHLLNKCKNCVQHSSV